MKALALTALLVTLPLAAQEAPKSQTTAATDTAAAETKGATVKSLDAAQQQGAPADSPLVQAAKRSRRAGSTRPVIDNEAVKKSKGGHLTTSTINPKLDINIPPSRERFEADERAKAKVVEGEKAKKEQSADAAKKDKDMTARARAAAAEDEGEYYDGDPAEAQPAAEAAAKPAPKPEKKP